MKSSSPRVLAVDVGGSKVKLLLAGETERRRFASGSELGPQEMVDGVLEAAQGWTFDVVSLGLPAPIVDGRVLRDPINLGSGWTDFEYERAFGRPVRLINDAAMQALGSYEGGRMLFLGLGTGLGTTLVIDGRVVGLELGHLPYRHGRSFEDYVGEAGHDRMGREKWEHHVHEVVRILRAALLPDDVVLGGGNVKKLEELPEGVRRGANANAFTGGFRLWEPRAGDGAAGTPR